MYEMVTGRVPFDGDNTVAIAIQHLQEEMVAPSAYAPDLPISLEKIILKATMKSPDRRYATISDMLMDLKRALVSPYEDFVNIVDSADLGKTQVMTGITPEEKRKAAATLMFEDDAPEDEEWDEYDEGEEWDEYDDYDDDEEDSKMDKIITISGIVAGIAIVIILVAILGNVVGLFKFGAKKVTMINVVGSTETQAIEDLNGIGLEEDNILVSYEESDKEAGVVIAQSTKEGDEFSLNDTLRLTVSGEPEKSEATSSDKSEASESKPAESKPAETPSNDGTTQQTENTQAPADNPAATDGKTIAVPSVVGLTQAEATTVLDAKKIVVTSTSQEYSDTIASGQVISQSIEPGTMVAENATITLVISKGAKSTTYSYSVANPFAGECTYSIAELNKTGTIPQNGSINISEVTKASLTITLTPVDPALGAAQTSTIPGTPN